MNRKEMKDHFREKEERQERPHSKWKKSAWKGV
jgi:hypothetical protein